MPDTDLDYIWNQNREIIALLTRIADALDPPPPEPDRTGLFTKTHLVTVERRRRPALKR